MFPELLNKQVICPRPEILQFMYPTFKIVKSEFEIYPGDPFIWNGDIKYIDKVKKRTEPYIIIANTGEYDLTDMKTLIDLAYIKHNKFSYKTLMHEGKPLLDSYGNPQYALDSNGNKIKETKIPQYMSDLLQHWRPFKSSELYSKEFLYNWKQLWVTGKVPDSEIEQNKLFLSIIEDINKPYQVLKSFLDASQQVDVSQLEKQLLRFIYDSMKPVDNLQERKLSKGQAWMMQRQNVFYNSYSKNVKKAINKYLIESKYRDNPVMRIYTLLNDILNGANEDMENLPMYNPINVTYKEQSSYLEEKKYLAQALSKTREFNTTLLLGELACSLFKQIYKGDMYTLKTAQDVRDFRDTYNFGTEDVLVFEDLSIMTPDTQAALLKFIEEPKRPLIVLCSKDNISGAMMSRFAHKVKLENKVQVSSIPIQDFISAKQSLREKQRTQNPDDPQQLTPEESEIAEDFNKACLHLCPEYWYYYEYAKKNLPNLYNLDMYIGLLNY